LSTALNHILNRQGNSLLKLAGHVFHVEHFRLSGLEVSGEARLRSTGTVRIREARRYACRAYVDSQSVREELLRPGGSLVKSLRPGVRTL
jgi:hypothetical protein